jgi:hypothetical protein
MQREEEPRESRDRYRQRMKPWQIDTEYKREKAGPRRALHKQKEKGMTT